MRPFLPKTFPVGISKLAEKRYVSVVPVGVEIGMRRSRTSVVALEPQSVRVLFAPVNDVLREPRPALSRPAAVHDCLLNNSIDHLQDATLGVGRVWLRQQLLDLVSVQDDFHPPVFLLRLGVVAPLACPFRVS